MNLSQGLLPVPLPAKMHEREVNRGRCLFILDIKLTTDILFSFLFLLQSNSWVFSIAQPFKTDTDIELLVFLLLFLNSDVELK